MGDDDLREDDWLRLSELQWTEDSSATYRELWGTAPGDSPTVPVGIVELSGCRLADDRGSTWTVVPDGRPTKTPMALVSIGETSVTVSMPVNPALGFPENASLVAVVGTATGNRLVTRFARQRRVASTLDGLIRSDLLLSGSFLLDEAMGLLKQKYQDAPAAALGALTLHRLGHLRDRPGWVENLARDFPWIPDGAVLLAAVLSHHADRRERIRGLEALLEVSTQRMMFTDGLALLLDLLRRWPDGDGADDRAAALRLAALGIGGVDWEAICLTVYEEDAEA